MNIVTCGEDCDKPATRFYSIDESTVLRFCEDHHCLVDDYPRRVPFNYIGNAEDYRIWQIKQKL